MWKDPDEESDDEKKRKEKLPKFKQKHTVNDDCEIFETEQVDSDELLSDIEDDLSSEEFSDGEDDGDDPLAAIAKREERQKQRDATREQRKAEKKAKRLQEAKERKEKEAKKRADEEEKSCLLYTSPSPRDRQKSRMPSSA